MYGLTKQGELETGFQESERADCTAIHIGLQTDRRPESLKTNCRDKKT
jgi:hypothetical protein